jgi:hypothetical protein
MAHRTGAPDMPRVLAVKSSRWSFQRWRTRHGAPDGPVCTGQPMPSCRVLAITFSSKLRFRWSCTFWKAYEIIYIPELKPYQFKQIWHTRQSGVHWTSHILVQFFKQFRLRIVGITFSSELRFWWSCTFWKAYKIIYISELKPCQFEKIWFCEILPIQSALPLNFVNFTFVLHLCISLLLLDVLES